jgi:hypothetical protein
LRPNLKFPLKGFGPNKLMEIICIQGIAVLPVDPVCSADNPMMLGNAEPSPPGPEAIDDEITRPTQFVARVAFRFEHVYLCA